MVMMLLEISKPKVYLSVHLNTPGDCRNRDPLSWILPAGESASISLEARPHLTAVFGRGPDLLVSQGGRRV